MAKKSGKTKKTKSKVGLPDLSDFSSDSEPEASSPAEKPVSLHPLEFEEAVRELLRAGGVNKEKQ